MIGVLEWLVKKVDWVFVSGGLGPTSDNRTRNVVAEVIGEKLVYAEEVWTQLLTAPPYTGDLRSPRVRRYYSEHALHA